MADRPPLDLDEPLTPSEREELTMLRLDAAYFREQRDRYKRLLEELQREVGKVVKRG